MTYRLNREPLDLDWATEYFRPSSYLNVPPPPSMSIPQWVINKLPKGAPVALRCDDGQWFIDGEPVHDTPYIKTGYMRTNAVALSVRAALCN